MVEDISIDVSRSGFFYLVFYISHMHDWYGISSLQKRFIEPIFDHTCKLEVQKSLQIIITGLLQVYLVNQKQLLFFIGEVISIWAS